jgi:hypothetical protein
MSGEPNHRHVRVVAQELQHVAPEMVLVDKVAPDGTAVKGAPGDGHVVGGCLQLLYSCCTAVCTAVVQVLNSELDPKR